MLNIILIVIVCIALATSILVGAYALFGSQSYKRNYFLLMQCMVIVYLFGHLLELTSVNAEEAFGAVKVLYTGSYLVGVFSFFFIADFCNIKLHPIFIKTPMILLSVFIILVMWTTRLHGGVYLDYGFDTTFTHILSFTPGRYYSLIHTYPTICMILCIVIIINQLRKWEGKYRKQLLLILLCVTIPFIAEGIYFVSIISGINKHQIYFTPHSLAIMSFCLYLGVMRLSIFEVISVATVSAMDHIREGFILVDENNNYLSSNPTAVRIIPGITKLLKGESVYSSDSWPEPLKNLESDSVEFSISGNSTRYYRASVSPVMAQNKSMIAKIILFSDITDNVNLMKELENAAYIDALTGLYNRKHFSELANVEIERAFRQNQSIFMVMLDLDFFKVVNDTHGHAAGDAVLKATASIIRQTIRAYDLLGRYGGEEFVLLLAAVDVIEAHRLMDRIRENMEHNIINYEGIEIKITCSIGLAKFQETDSLETSIKKADEALYAAKNSGRNKVTIYGDELIP